MTKATVHSSLTTELLLVLFVALKLTHVIAWSWLWVLSPFWIPAAVAITVGLVYLLVLLGVVIFKACS